MQAIVCGGAFNFLNIKAFIESVENQHWRDPANLQLLIQDESEERFTLYEFNQEMSLQRKN
ncbi:MAG TPA: hypothetical protein V6D15_07995 [Oculatellaceae cyanobacterium]|jgi:hypothetical protein